MPPKKQDDGKVKCKVVGNHALHGVQPGGTIYLEADEAFRYALAGHVTYGSK